MRRAASVEFDRKERRRIQTAGCLRSPREHDLIRPAAVAAGGLGQYGEHQHDAVTGARRTCPRRLPGIDAAAGACPRSQSPPSTVTAIDRTPDITDWYAFVSPDAPDTVTMILAVDPLLEPGNGPNYFPFDDNLLVSVLHRQRSGRGAECRVRYPVQDPDPPARRAELVQAHPVCARQIFGGAPNGTRAGARETPGSSQSLYQIRRQLHGHAEVDGSSQVADVEGRGHIRPAVDLRIRHHGVV